MTEPAQGQDAFTNAVAGDRAAFAELVRKHQAMVFSIALHSLRDRALAEELAQEVFLDFFNHLRDLQSAAHAEFWLRKVTTRRCIDYVRRRKRQISIALDDAPELSTPPVDADPFLGKRFGNLRHRCRNGLEWWFCSGIRRISRRQRSPRRWRFH